MKTPKWMIEELRVWLSCNNSKIKTLKNKNNYNYANKKSKESK